MPLLVSWPLKRAVIARLKAYAAGTQPPPAGAGLLATGQADYASPVQVEYVIPAEPDRLCVFGAPIRAARQERTAELGGTVVETVSLELRCRVFTPGEDVIGVDTMLGGLAEAVVNGVLGGAPFFTQGHLSLTSITQDPTAVAPNPEPSVTGNVSLLFTAEVVTV